MKRRVWLKLMLALSSGLFSHAVWARREAFAQQSYEEAVARLLPNIRLIDSEQIELHIPEIAENGAVVPVTISTQLTDIEQIHILVEKNPTPLAASFHFSKHLRPNLTTRIKMAESCHVVVVAKHNEQWLQQKRWVTVMVGGCGTG